MKYKKIRFMLNKIYTDLTVNKVPFKLSDDLHSQKLGEYYLLFEEDPQKLNKLINDFDEKGVPLNTTYIDVNTSELHYYPISIGQYGLAVFNSYIHTNDEKKKNHFLNIADWFYENKNEDNELGAFWLTDVPKPEYKVYKPWKSAFTQSRAISVLLRAWQCTNDEKYLDLSKKALLPFTKDIKDGGVTAFTKYGPFFEEYVASEPTMVLDGHIFSLFGLYDFYRAVKNDKDHKHNTKAKQLFDEGVESLINWLPKYDLGFWLRFNMCRMDHYPKIDPCTIGYLNLVTLQIKLLYKLTQRTEFNEYYKKIEGYNNIYNKLRMYPVKYKALKKLDRL